VAGRWVRTVAVVMAGGLLVAGLAGCGDGEDGADTAEAPVGAPGAPVSMTVPGDDGLRTTVASSDGRLELETTSTRASLVTGGDVLVTVSGAAAGDATLTAGGRDVTDVLSIPDADGRRRGVVGDLANGDTELVVAAADSRAALTVTSHPIAGPILSGPHLEPWVCETESIGLGPAQDDDCNVESQTTWSYVSTAGGTRPYEPGSAPPADLAVSAVDGNEVPLVVRIERGVINRGVYRIAVLDPAALEPGATAATLSGEWDDSAWNGRLVYRFGGGCGTQYAQGTGFGEGGEHLDLLPAGYAVATNTLNTFQTACNATLSAESMFMTREHFLESFGVPQFTIGDGGSGGAIQQLTIATAYPGALDGLSVSAPFPDALSLAGSVTDCGLLLKYYETPTGAALDSAQRDAISGHVSSGTCENWSRLFLSAINPSVGCSNAIADEVYEPVTRPDGVRCTLQDINVNSLGRDPANGFALRPLDNVGVQYGLEALGDGVLDPEAFLDLNENIGGYDIDGTIVDEREQATAGSLATVYRSNAISGGDQLLELPIILQNAYADDVGDIHTRSWSFTIRERLRREGSDAPNLLLWTLPGESALGSLVGSLTGGGGGARTNPAVELIDRWLTDGARPAQATNRCTLPDGTELAGGWELYDTPGPCLTAYPVSGEPRFAAGQPLSAEAITCQLRTPRRDDYPNVSFTDTQWERLLTIFSDGVCDWSAPGVGMGETRLTWPSFGR
jgi:hypothetical protein